MSEQLDSDKIYTQDELPEEMQEAFKKMKSDLLLCFLGRLGGEITLPVEEVDAAGDFYMNIETNPSDKTFKLTLHRKE